jgi:hypothetical protein
VARRLGRRRRAARALGTDRASVAGAPLAGPLDAGTLADILRALDGARRSGVLAVDAGDGVRRGLLRLRRGGVAAARFRAADGRELRHPVDAAAAMLALGAGRFTFVPDPPSADAGEPAGLRVDTLLLEATRRGDERAAEGPGAPVAPRRDVAGPDTRSAFARPADAAPYACDAGPLALPASDWALLADADRRRCDAAAGPATGARADRAAMALDALARRGLVLLGAAPGAIAGRRVAPASVRPPAG